MAIELPQLKLWQWGAVVGGGVALGLGVRWYRSRQTSAAPSEEVQELQAVAEALSAAPLPGSSTGPYAGWNQTSDPPPSSAAQAVWSTNDDWHREVAQALGRTGTFDFIEVDAALAAYLTGVQLDAKQYAIVDLAIRTYGYPPSPPGYPQRKPDPIDTTPIPNDPNIGGPQAGPNVQVRPQDSVPINYNTPQYIIRDGRPLRTR